jgi:Plant mobile domain
MQLDRSLLTALVDRWRPETHTFHLPCGEMAPTLQDVSFLLGLPIDGDAVGPRVVPATWREDLDIRFAGVDRMEDLGWLDPHPDEPGPSKSWLLQFKVIHSVPLYLRT